MVEQELRLKTRQNVSYLNPEALIGGIIGSFVPVPVVGTLGGVAIGSAIGGYLGKNRLERENSEGKVITAPTAWNREAVVGAAVGVGVAHLVGLAVFALGGAAAVALASPPLAALAVAGAFASMAAAPVIGAIKGGEMGKRRQEEEADAALIQREQEMAAIKQQSEKEGKAAGGDMPPPGSTPRPPRQGASHGHTR